MDIYYSREITISTQTNRKDTSVKREVLPYHELLMRCASPVRSAETRDAYAKLTKAQQADLKDVGGFVGGSFTGNRRKAVDVAGRSLISLDFDAVPQGQTDALFGRLDGLGCAYFAYTTRNHSAYTPRMRACFLLDKDCTAEEYEPIARKLAELTGAIAWCDPTTFEASRLMYYPSVCSDGEFAFRYQDRPLLSRDGMLGLYADWHDTTSWAVVPGQENAQRQKADKAQNPLDKTGVVGAFCRKYTITDAMAEFIPDAYVETTTPGRYTYAKASTYGGAVVYDDLFLYSHHATDPVCNQLVNAWDLVRSHKYGDLDDDMRDGTPQSSAPSWAAMRDLALSIPEIKAATLTERMTADEAFGDAAPDASAWLTQMETTRSGAAAVTLNNFRLIVENDTELTGRIAKDIFDQSWYVKGRLPWLREWELGKWRSNDDANLCLYVEKKYGIYSPDKLSRAVETVAGDNMFNSVEDYLTSLTWDGVPRIDTLLIDYFCADDNCYTRAVMRKTLCAAVARAVCKDPQGVKFDTMPVLIGAQGVGKTMFIAAIGKGWYTSDIQTFDKKVAGEVINGKWIVELGELVAMNRSDPEGVKQFLSTTIDRYRAAYGHYAEDYIRRCIFIGSTNDDAFLHDLTGNRRFWPVNVYAGGAKDPHTLSPEDVDQIWAEAYALYLAGEPLRLSDEEEAIALVEQASHEEDDPLFGEIEEYVKRQIPENWYEIGYAARKDYLENGYIPLDARLVPRDRICAKEVFVHVMGGRPEYYSPNRDGRRINQTLKRLTALVSSKMYFGDMGQQRGYWLPGIEQEADDG